MRAAANLNLGALGLVGPRLEENGGIFGGLPRGASVNFPSMPPGATMGAPVKWCSTESCHGTVHGSWQSSMVDGAAPQPLNPPRVGPCQSPCPASRDAQGFRSLSPSCQCCMLSVDRWPRLQRIKVEASKPSRRACRAARYSTLPDTAERATRILPRAAYFFEDDTLTVSALME